jgi:hypothetical protein
METKKLLNQSKKLISNELDFCNPMDTPIICDKIKNLIGRKMIEAQILEMVGKRGLTISMAIADLENQLTLNSI